MGIKTLLHLFLVAILIVILVMPLIEIFILYRDKILLSATIHNSLRAAEESSYAYRFMRDINAVVDKEAFCNNFADTFATSYNIYCTDYRNPLRFTPYDDAFNEFVVKIDFSAPEILGADEGEALVTKVTVTAESIYKFRTKAMQFLNDIATDPYLLREERAYTMKVTN